MKKLNYFLLALVTLSAFIQSGYAVPNLLENAVVSSASNIEASGTEQSVESITNDSLALVALYNNCGGEDWNGFDSWLTEPLSNWKNVTVSEVDGVNRVTFVEFLGMTLTGTLPSELGDLTELTGKVQFRDQTGLTGEFPSFIWNWTKVEKMQIKFCGFTSMNTTGMDKMVNLVEINTQGTPFEGEVPMELFTLPVMRDIYLEDGKWSSLPSGITFPTPTPIRRFYLNGNMFDALPDMTGIVWAEGAKAKFQDNKFTFEDLAPVMGWVANPVLTFTYSPQAEVGTSEIVVLDAGAAKTIESNVGGTDNIYTWLKGEDAVSEEANLAITSFDPATQSGMYSCFVQNEAVPGLVIQTAPVSVYESRLMVDSLALVALYNNCGGEDWNGFDSWLTEPLSNWKNVTVSEVDGVSRVTFVEFLGMTLTGTLPAELGDLTELTGKVQFRDQTGLTGEFPSFIWNWTKVEKMQIKFCGFTSMNTTGMDKMVNLVEINTQGTPFEGEVPMELFTLPVMRDIYLEDGKWSSLPSGITFPTPTPIRRLYLNGNMFDALPDMTGIVWAEGAKAKFQDNKFTFEDLTPVMGWLANPVLTFTYSPQAEVGMSEVLILEAGATKTLLSNVGGTGNVYSWLKGDDVVGEDVDFSIASFDPLTMGGKYYCAVQNTSVPGLVIQTAPVSLYGSQLAIDSVALVTLYNNCGGADWTGFDTWLEGPLSTWENVTVSDVDGVSRVTFVEFLGMTLSGTLPLELGDLTEMTGKIQLKDQPDLTGEFPSFIWNWTKVEKMQIKNCGFTSMDTTGMHKMVNLVEINTQNTPFEGEVPMALFTLPVMEDIYLESGKWSSLPSDIVFPTPAPIRRFYLNGNMFDALPDMTGIVWAEGAKAKFQDNKFTFEDLEPVMGWLANPALTFTYSPQALFTEKETITVEEGETISMSASCGGSENFYTWLKNGEVIDGEDQDVLQISSAAKTDEGDYQCVVQNTLVAGLDLMSDTFTVVVNTSNAINEIESIFRVNGNPVRNLISIDSDILIERMLITDISGKIYADKAINAKSVRHAISDYKEGTYLVSLKTKTSRKVVKIVKL